MTDDQDAASVRTMETVRTELIRGGASFEHAYATFPLCCPSRATFLTGQYAHNHGILSNHLPDGGFPKFRSSQRQTLPVALQDSGYHTAFVGKYLNGYQAVGKKNPDGAIPPGWDSWVAELDNLRFDYQVNVNGCAVSFGDAPSDYQTDVFGRFAAGFIRRATHKDAPFFLAVMPSDPHVEEPDPAREGPGRAPRHRPAPRHRGAFSGLRFRKPPAFNERDVSDKPRFVRERPPLASDQIERVRRANIQRLTSLQAVDDMVAQLLSELRRSEELDNTYIIFTSDNGFLAGEHRLRRKDALYEEATRVPLIIRGPLIAPGSDRAQLVGNIDLAPTILDIAGSSPGFEVDGISLLPLAAKASVAKGRDLLLENERSSAVRTRRFMYAQHELRSQTEYELYDMRSDPFQLENLLNPETDSLVAPSPTLKKRLAELRDRLTHLRRCHGTTGRASCL